MWGNKIMKKLVLFGASKMGKEIGEALELPINYFIDNDPEKWGEKFLNKDIKSPQELLNERRGDIIIGITSSYYNEISSQLKTLGYKENKDFFDLRDIHAVKEKETIEKVKSIIFGIMRDNLDLYKSDDYVLTTKRISTLGITNIELWDLFVRNNIELIYIESYIDFNKKCQYKPIDKRNYFSMNYKGINLYDVVIFNVCNELCIMEKEFFIDNPNHYNVLEKYYEMAIEYIDAAYSILEKVKVSKSLLFHGYDVISNILRKVSIINNIDTYTFEVTLDKEKIIWDNVSCIPTNKNLAKNYFWRYESLIDDVVCENYRKKYLANVKKQKIAEHVSSNNQLNKLKDRKTILFLAQVYVDSSIIFGINDFGTPIHLINDIIEYSLNHDLELIIKLHPSETYSQYLKNRELTYKKLLKSKFVDEITNNYNIILDHDNKYDTYSLIDRADLCVTINSQAGLESLLKGKEVILCGESFYGGLGFTYDAYDKRDLYFYLDRIILEGDRRNNIKRISKFFYIFNELYCINKNALSILELLGRQQKK